MHELSIADAILAVAREHAGDRRLASVSVHVGHLRQVVPGALAFAFELLAPGVELEIVEIPARGACRACGAETALPAFPLCCEWCGSTAVDVVQGEELSVESLEVDVEEPLAMTGRAEP